MDTAPTRSNLSLRGSSKIVAEFFEFSINSILYQRGIYPSDDFQIVKKYGLNLLITIDDDIQAYIKKILLQLHRWVLRGKISRLILAIIDKNDGDVVERWQFNIQVFDDDDEDSIKIDNNTNVNSDKRNVTDTENNNGKSIEEIQKEIQAIIRQITASVTFLPTLETGDYTFNILVYADADAKVPTEWIDADSKEISNAETVKFRSFSTSNHKVDTLVSYKLDE